ASLLETLRDGADPGAWRRFFECYAPAVFRVARLRGCDPHDAEDVVQQVMITIAREVTRFDYDRDRGRFRQWVRTVAENKMRDYHRREMVVGRKGEVLHESLPDADELWRQQWWLQDVVQCLDEIAADVAPRRIEAFRLYVLEGVSAEEVARR